MHRPIPAQSRFGIVRAILWAPLVAVVLLAPFGVAAWWFNRPQVVGPSLCRELAENVVRRSGGEETAGLVVGDVVRVTQLEDGSYRIGMTIEGRGDARISLPFYCRLTSVDGQWRAVVTE